MLNVDSLKRGIVIDHIKAGSCMDIYKYLELDKLDCSVAIIKNAKSNAMGKKDIIKVEGLLDIDLDVLGFIDCDITVNVIDDQWKYRHRACVCMRGEGVPADIDHAGNHTQCGILQKSTLYHFH